MLINVHQGGSLAFTPLVLDASGLSYVVRAPSNHNLHSNHDYGRSQHGRYTTSQLNLRPSCRHTNLMTPRLGVLPTQILSVSASWWTGTCPAF